jgi:hypothetical protein
MIRSCSLILAASFLAFASTAEAGASLAPIPYEVNISHDSFDKLIELGKFDVKEVDGAVTDDPQQEYGKSILYLVNFGKEFASYADVLKGISAKGMVPGTCRDLLAYAAQVPKNREDHRRIIAFGSPVNLPSGTLSWQAYGVNESNERFFFPVVEGEGWPSNFFYLAKYPARPSGKNGNADRWQEMQKISKMIAARIAKAKRNKLNPNAFFAMVSTNLSYCDIAAAAYYQPKSLAEADKPDVSVRVLGKALLERNIATGHQHDIKCFFEPCEKRMVEVILTQEGLGIYDAPIPKGSASSSGRLIYP